MRTQSGSGWSLISFFLFFLGFSYDDDETQAVGPGGWGGGSLGGHQQSPLIRL